MAVGQPTTLVLNLKVHDLGYKFYGETAISEKA